MKRSAKKIKRSAELIAILSKYGFNELLIQSKLKKPEQNPVADQVFDKDNTLYERIRMALEELGATFVKLGQTFSNREDLLPQGLIQELKKLQDKVEPQPLDVHQILQEELGIRHEDFFKHIDHVPLASASISQVYKATLLDGTPVVLKVKRPGIKEEVSADLLLIKDIANLLTHTHETFRKIRLLHVVASFEKSIFEELSFLQEAHNIEVFGRNFKDNPAVSALRVYREFSNDTILCMNYVDGTKISDKTQLQEKGLSPALIAQRGLDLYLTQVIAHGFFHADPHPGNILVLHDGRITFLDLGSVGKLLPRDKELLEDFIINFITKDSKRLIQTIKKMALEIEITDEHKLERAIENIFDILDNDSLEHIDVKSVIKKFSVMLNDNDVLMPEYLYLLLRGIILIEGIGRTLDPEMNIIESVRPYIHKIILRRLEPKHLLDKAIHQLRNLSDGLTHIPEDLREIVSKLKQGELVIVHQDREKNHALKHGVQAVHKLALSLLTGCLFITSALLLNGNTSPQVYGFPLLGLAVLSIALVLGGLVVLSGWRTKK